MKFWERLGNVDRRIIYILIAVVVIVPLILTVKLPSKVRAMPRTRDVFNHIENIDINGKRKALLISIDFDPQSEPELKPQVEAVVRHAFAKNIPIMLMSYYPQGVDIGREILDRLGAEHGKVYGRDYVHLGWKPGGAAVVLGLGNFIDQTFPTDLYGTPLSEIPMMSGIRNYDDMGLVMSFTASSTYGAWIVYAYTTFGVPVAVGVTSVSVADIYPYLGSRQLIGELAGMKAAAEYERLVKDKYYPDFKVTLLGTDSYKVTLPEKEVKLDADGLKQLVTDYGISWPEFSESLASALKKPGDEFKYQREIFLRATQALPALSASLLVIIVFVILGNISYFATRRK